MKHIACYMMPIVTRQTTECNIALTKVDLKVGLSIHSTMRVFKPPAVKKNRHIFQVNKMCVVKQYVPMESDSQGHKAVKVGVVWMFIPKMWIRNTNTVFCIVEKYRQDLWTDVKATENSRTGLKLYTPTIWFGTENGLQVSVRVVFTLTYK